MTTRGRSGRKRSHDSASDGTTATSSSTSTTTRSSILKKNKQKNKQKTMMKKASRALSLSSSTVQAVAVLFLAILTGMVWNMWDGSNAFIGRGPATDSRTRNFLDRVCQDNDVYCHPSLVPKRRTQMAIRDIHPGQHVLEVPRSMQIWDLDALRNDWIRQHLFGAKHWPTGNPLDSAAYLAAYLALLSKGIVQLSRNHNAEKADDETATSSESHRLLQYLNECMPSTEELAEFHPMFWNETELKNFMRPHSATYAVAKAYRDMVKSEYQAFLSFTRESTNEDLREMITEEEYQTYRVLVLTRSFGTGPLPIGSSSSSDASLSQEEIQYYRENGGVDLSRGSYAMVPILDFYDHHAIPNVQYAYSNDKQSFVIQAINQGISAGYEVVDNYGKYTGR
jgi:hypothetical protein